MGLWSNLKNKIKEMINRSRTPKLDVGQEYQYYGNYANEYLTGGTQIIDLGNGYDFAINSIEFDKQVQHSDGRFSNIMIASTSKGKYGDTMIFSKEGSDKVVFEIPAGEAITNTILSKLAGYSNYLNSNNQKYSYIGEIDDNPNNNSLKMSNTVERYMNSELIPRFENERNEHMKKIEKSNREIQENYMDSLKVDLDAKKREEEEIKNNRKQNPYFKRIDNSMDLTGKGYSNYNAVNINTGDVLRIRNLDKVGKDENGDYLYKAFIANTTREESTVYNTDYIGGNYVPVCFTSRKKIEDIVAEQNYNDINSVLEMFSQPQVFNEAYCQNNKLNYIGSLDSKLSDTMKKSILEIQENFSNKMAERNMGNERL